jgi:hypothetical protein
MGPSFETPATALGHVFNSCGAASTFTWTALPAEFAAASTMRAATYIGTDATQKVSITAIVIVRLMFDMCKRTFRVALNKSFIASSPADCQCPALALP